MREQDETLTQILQAADKHPNSRVAKLIRGVVDEPSQKNIVLLLIELSEHAEFATDFGISLKYYLDLYDRLGVGRDIVLNEAGLLLLNSSKIYSRRVDYVHELMERQILTLSAADQEIEKSNNDAQQTATTAEKPKRGRKRLVEAPNDPYEVELVPKKLRKLSAEKRFAVVAPKTKPKATSQSHPETEQYVHPAGWQHAHIVDLDNEEEIDSKRNYKLFTYHIEHRYNTLVPDINFRLHFKVKDYIDEEEERMQDNVEDGCGEAGMGEQQAQRRLVWPPLSEAYVNKYLNLENHILAREQLPQAQRTNFEALNECTTPTHDEHFGDADDMDVGQQSKSAENETQHISENPALEQVQNLNLSNESATDAAECNTDDTLNASLLNSANESTQNDSGLGNSLLDSSKTSSNDSVNISISLCEADKSISDTTAEIVTEPETTTETTAPSEQVQSLASTTENSATLECSDDLSTTVDNLNTTNANDQTTLQNDSALGHSLVSSTADESMRSNESNTSASILEQSLDVTLPEAVRGTTTSDIISPEIEMASESVRICLNTSAQMQRMDSGFDNSLSDVEKTPTKEKSIDLPESQSKLQETDDTQINLGEIRVHLPHLEDAAYFSDLDDQEKRMLSPTVMAADIFPGIPNKMNITIIIDEELKALMSIEDDHLETFVMPVEKQHAVTPIVHNILKFDHKVLKRRVLFTLGPELDLYLQARSLKRTRTVEPREYLHKIRKEHNTVTTDFSPTPTRELEEGFFGFPENENGISRWRDSENGSICFSPSRDVEEGFIGFPDDEQEHACTDDEDNHRLSRDSGMGVDVPVLLSKSNLDIIKEEDSGVESAGNSESLEYCVQNLFGDLNATNNMEIVVPTAETASNEIVSAEISVFLDKLLDEAAATPVDTEELRCATETTENVTAETNLTQTDATQESSTNTELDTADEINQEQCIAPSVDDTNTDNPTETNNECNKYGDITSMDAEDWNNDEVHVINNNHHRIEQELDETLADIELNNSKTKIQRWHEHLLPILAKSRERHHFDVFKIGTEIIDKLQPDDDDDEEDHRSQSKCISFQDVMENKDESYVSRYFLSSLLLANQNNIKFTVNNKSSEAPSAWSDVQFELLSTHRHTVAIEDNIGMIRTKPQIPSAKKPNNSKAKASLQNTNTIGGDESCSTINNKSNSGNISAKETSISRRDNISTTSSSQHSNCLMLDNDVFNVNLNIVRPLKQIEKMPRNNDDYDSGIFSSEDMVSLC